MFLLSFVIGGVSSGSRWDRSRANMSSCCRLVLWFVGCSDDGGGGLLGTLLLLLAMHEINLVPIFA